MYQIDELIEVKICIINYALHLKFEFRTSSRLIKKSEDFFITGSLLQAVMTQRVAVNEAINKKRF